MEEQNVYYLITPIFKPIIAADRFIKPNAFIGTLDGKYLFEADIGAGKTYSYTVNNDGSLKGKHLFAKVGV